MSKDLLNNIDIYFKNQKNDANKIITLCGSSKYKILFRILERNFALKGYLVISLSIFAHYDKILLTKYQKELLDKIHKRKIDLADIVYIVNVNNYIGLSIINEIEYAKEKGKEIKYYSNIGIEGYNL